MKIVYLFLLLCPLFLYADCGDVRLDKTSLKHVPILDQDGSGTCWAYTAATMIDAYRFSHGDKNYDKVTSPLHIAIQEYGITGGTGIYGLHTHQGLEMAGQMKQVCSHYEVSKTYTSPMFASVTALPPRGGFLNLLTGGVRLDTREFFPCPPKGSWEGGILDHWIGNWFDFRPRNYLKEFYLDDMSKINQKVVADDMIKNCPESERIEINIPSYSRIFSAINEDTGEFHKEKVEPLKAALRKHFSDPNKGEIQPIGLGYCSALLFDRSFIYSNQRQNDCGKHASTIVGSRQSPTNPNVCQYLIRNSWGRTRPSGLDWDYEKDPGGEAWVDEDSIIKNGFSFISL